MKLPENQNRIKFYIGIIKPLLIGSSYGLSYLLMMAF